MTTALSYGGPHGMRGNWREAYRAEPCASICAEGDSLYPGHEWQELLPFARAEEDGANCECSLCHVRAYVDEGVAKLIEVDGKALYGGTTA